MGLHERLAQSKSMDYITEQGQSIVYRRVITWIVISTRYESARARESVLGKRLARLALPSTLYYEYARE